jgi:hypothetical protein
MKDDQRENAASPDPAKEVYWTPLMAVVWIVYRDTNEVRKVWSGFVKDCRDFNFEKNQKYLVHPKQAVGELWRRLESGAVVATGIFEGLRRVIEPWEWCDLQPIDCEQPARFFYGRQFPRKIYIGRPQLMFDDVRLAADALLRLFPPKDRMRNESLELGARPPPAEGPRSSSKPALAQATATALSQRYPEGRPSKKGDQLLRELEPEVGVISPRTLTRALALAWPSVRRPSDKK